MCENFSASSIRFIMLWLLSFAMILVWFCSILSFSIEDWLISCGVPSRKVKYILVCGCIPKHFLIRFHQVLWWDIRSFNYIWSKFIFYIHIYTFYFPDKTYIFILYSWLVWLLWTGLLRHAQFYFNLLVIILVLHWCANPSGCWWGISNSMYELMPFEDTLMLWM